MMFCVTVHDFLGSLHVQHAAFLNSLFCIHQMLHKNGRTIHPLVAETIRPGVRQVIWMKQLAQALVHIHLKDVFHQDIKAENLLLSKRKEIKLADFGLAILVESRAASAMPSKKGTTIYFSPEKACGNGSDDAGKSDTWAAGCVLVELVACERLSGPLWDDRPEVRAQRERWIQQAESASPLLGQVARGLLELCPERRLSARDMLIALEGGGAAPHASSSPAPLQVRSTKPVEGSFWHRVAHAWRLFACVSTLTVTTLTPYPSLLTPQPLSSRLLTLSLQHSSLTLHPSPPSLTILTSSHTLSRFSEREGQGEEGGGGGDGFVLCGSQPHDTERLKPSGVQSLQWRTLKFHKARPNPGHSAPRQ